MVRVLFAAPILIAAAVSASAQPRRGAGGAVSCNDFGNSDRGSACEVREETIPGAGVNPLDVDAGRNGGIRVRGWDRPDVLVRARVAASADSNAEARQIVSGVRVVTSGGTIRAEGPEANSGSGNWSVSFELNVPRTAMLTLNARNGGVSIEDFQGAAKFHAVNGGVTLRNVSGDIRGETVNGGLTIDLTGDHWNGAGLDVETQNGGIRMTLPEQYSASLETATTNGRINIDFPVTVSGRITRSLTTTLGAGGAKLRAVTTNGGVTIRKQ
jgi:putative adhesin